MGTIDCDPLLEWDFWNLVYDLKAIFGNRRNFWKWKIRKQEIEQEIYFRLLSLGYY